MGYPTISKSPGATAATTAFGGPGFGPLSTEGAPSGSPSVSELQMWAIKQALDQIERDIEQNMAQLQSRPGAGTSPSAQLPPGPESAPAPAGTGAPATVAPTSATGPTQPSAAASPSQTSAPPTAAQQQVIDGFGTSMPASDAKAPPGMTAADIGKLGGGVLDNMGNTDLQGKGGMKDLLAQRCGGKDASSIATDPDVAWRAYQTTMAVKNRDAGGGKAQSSDARFDGKIDGFFKDHSQGGKLNANHGTDAGAMQDLLLHNEVPPPAQDIAKPPAPGTTQAQQLAIDGNTTDLPAAGEKAPPGLSPADIAGLNGNLLGGLGQQSVTIDGQSMSLRAGLVLRYGDDSEKAEVKNAKTPEEKDAAARKALQTNSGTAWRAYRALTAVRNETANDGTPKPTGMRHNGRIGGYTKAGADGLAPHGSEAGSLQDLLQSGRVPSRLESDPNKWTDKFGQGQSESQVAMKEFKDFGWKILTAGLAVVAAPIAAVLAPVAGVAGGVAGAVAGGVEGAVAGGVEGGVAGAVAGGVEGGVTGAVEGGVEGGVTGAAAGGAEGGAAGGAEGAAAGGAEGGAAGAAEGGASLSANAIRSVAQQIASQTGKLTEEQAEQAVRATLKEIGTQAKKFGKDQLKDYVKQEIEAKLNGTQQPAPEPTQVAWDQPRAMSDAGV